jgi:hypothetical protein
MPSEADEAPNEKKGKIRASVHYPADIVVPPHVTEHDHQSLQSAASSVAGTDDEDDGEYDWSDEEDLVDEEAKFEERMGNAPKKSGWGFKR